MTTSETRFAALHAQWHKLSGLTLPKWSFNILHRWETLLVECERAGMSMPMEQAMPLVIARIKREGKKFYGYYQHLSFYRLTKSEVFIDHLSAALAEARKPAKPANVVAMETLTGKKYELPGTEARKASEVINSEGFKKLMKFRDEL